MTKCKECGTDISTKADACPKCGAKQIRTSGCAKVALGFIIFFVFVSIVGTCSRNNSTSSSSPTPDISTSTTSSAATSATATTELPVAPAIGAQWSYAQDEDPMGKGTTYFAQVTSSNTVTFDSPYGGPQHGKLMLRTHPRYGKDVILAIERVQFLCRSYEDCNILVRFDDQKASNYSAVGAADNSTESIFIRNYPRFIASMLKAKRVRISAEIYQEGSPVFEFDVSGFDETKYKPKQ
jgi:hypothetical protein